MTTDEIKLVKRSWKILMGVDPSLLGETFYSKLFADHPELRSLFPKDMKEQYIKLTEMMSSIIMRLDHPDIIAMTEMGARHIKYGVKQAHYKMVGEAMLWMLSKALGSEWNTPTAAAWIQCYQELTKAMTGGAPKHLNP